MRRTLARLGLLTILGATPIVLGGLIGSPAIPDFTDSDGLSGSFVPVEAVLRLLGLLSWGLWAYLTFAIVLHGAATIAAIRHAPGQRALSGLSSILTPRVVRSLVEFAIGSALVAGSVSVRASSALPAASPPVFVEAGPMRSAVELFDRAGVSELEKETCRVRTGDSLWRIAERELGSGFRWREIYRLNEGRRFSDGRILTDPQLIYPGWVLDLPDGNQASPAPQDSDDPDLPTDHDRPTLSHAPTEPSPTSSHRSPPEQTPTEREPGMDTEEAETPPPSPAFEIPSGLLVAASFASGLLTAHLLARLHRRRARRLSGASSVEPPIAPDMIRDLRRAGASELAGPVDIALDAVIETWRDHAGKWPRIIGAAEAVRHVSVILGDRDDELPRNSGGTVSPHVRFVRAGTTVIAEVEGPFPAQLPQSRSPLERGLLVPVGRASDGSVVHLSAIGIGLMSVAGPAAASLMRQIVLEAATQGGPDDLRVILVAGDEASGPLSQLPQVVGAHLWEEAPDALRNVELELIRRARIFMREGVEDVQRHLAEHSDERLPAILVVCEEPPPALIGRVEALAQQASTLGAAFLALGWTPRIAEVVARVEASVELEADLPCPKTLEPFLLDGSAEQEAIDIIGEAHPPETEEEIARESLEKDEESPDPVEIQSAPAPAPPVLRGEDPLLLPDEVPGPQASMMAIRCLGPFEILRDDTPVRTGWKAKGREMVAYLVANPSGAPKERIVEELWPGVDPKIGVARFDRTATLVRSRARGTEDSRMYIERIGDSAYRLEEGAWRVDAWEFEGLVRDAERTEDAAEAVSMFQAALALYRGEFCDDTYYPWAEDAREAYRNLFIEASARLAYRLSDAGEHDEALAALDRAIKVDPVCEDLVRRAMAVEATLGRRAAALTRYRKLEATLDEQLSVEPDPDTQALVRKLYPAKELAER